MISRFLTVSDGEVASPRSLTGKRFLILCLCDLIQQEKFGLSTVCKYLEELPVYSKFHLDATSIDVKLLNISHRILSMWSLTKTHACKEHYDCVGGWDFHCPGGLSLWSVFTWWACDLNKRRLGQAVKSTFIFRSIEVTSFNPAWATFIHFAVGAPHR